VGKFVKGPCWYKRWSKIGPAYYRAQELGKPIPKLFRRLQDKLWDERFARAAATGKKKRLRSRPEESKLLRTLRIRKQLAGFASAMAAYRRPTHDLFEEMKASPEVAAFVANRERACELYAALCNVDWIKSSDDEPWGCSWRSAGSKVAYLRQKGEYYMDFYCSGNEGIVSAAVADLLKGLGWTAIPLSDEE
jgi:hypothetical protein